MSRLLLVILVFLVNSASPFSEEEFAFLQWKQEFNINYSDDSKEAVAFRTFCSNRRRIIKHNEEFNACNVSYALGLWKKSDLNNSEVDAELNGLSVGLEGRAIFIGGNEVKPANVSSLNYVDMGYVAGVQDQGNCGSCWSFASVAALEAQIFKKYQRLTKLSEQQLVDCSGSYGNLGCIAGVVGYAYKYIKDNGIARSSKYKYKGVQNSCSYNATLKNATINGYSWVYVSDETFLRDILFSVGPLAVGVDASPFTFQNYKTGVYNDPRCSQSINHAMTLVGFGTHKRWGDYWLLKNSYGVSWGEKGYMRLARGVNRCGIKNYVVFPNV